MNKEKFMARYLETHKEGSLEQRIKNGLREYRIAKWRCDRSISYWGR